MPASTILLLDSDAAAGDVIKGILTGTGYTITQTADTDEAFTRAAEHQLVIIDATTGPKSPAEICREIRATPAMSSVPVMCISASEDVEERILFLEAGADDVMARPFDARELEARVEALLLRFRRSKDLAPLVSADGLTLSRIRRTVAVFSPKGGVGTTTIATNLALSAAATRPDRVVIVDFDFQFGNVPMHLNLDPKQTLADVVREEAALREPELLRTFAMRHDSGLHVLAAPIAPEAGDAVTPAHIGQIVAGLLEGYDIVVMDAGSVLDERTLAIFESAESVVLALSPEIGALKAMHALLEFLAEAGSIGLKATFVLNNIFARQILKVQDVESFLGAKIAVELPYDPFLYLKSVDEGVPVVAGAPRSAPAEHILRLRIVALGEEGYRVPASPTAKKPGGLFRRRRQP